MLPDHLGVEEAREVRVRARSHSVYASRRMRTNQFKPIHFDANNVRNFQLKNLLQHVCIM